MNKYESFLERNTIRLYKKVDEFYEVESHLEYAIKGSICVDLLVFMIEALNKINNQEISHSVINGLVDALDSVFPVKVFYKMQDFASSKDEAAALLTELYETGEDPQKLVATNYDLSTLIGKLYNFRVTQYFAENRDPIMVISAVVPMMIRHAKITDHNMELMQEIDKILLDCMAKIPKLADSKSYQGATNPEEMKKSNCYIVTAASGSSNSELVVFYRNFRDNYLSKYPLGLRFIDFYYRNAPFFAKKIEQNTSLKKLSFWLLILLKKIILQFK